MTDFYAHYNMILLPIFFPQVILAQCVVHLCRAPKSVEVYKAYTNAKACVREHQGPLPSVPLHLRNASTKLMKSLGKLQLHQISIPYPIAQLTEIEKTVI